MRKKNILDSCETIYSVFDDLEDGRFGFRESGKLRSLAFGLIDEDKRVKSIFRGEDLEEIYRKEEDKLTTLECDLFMVGFSLGYVIGQSFDIPYTEVKKPIESIKRLVKERALLPYLPREKERRGL